MTKHKKLPIGIQTFKDIRNPANNYVYIDKTKLCFTILDNAKYYFLSRPRRFGKSLFLDTLSEIFKGSKDLFEGLFIHDKWDWSEKFPVIRIDLGAGDFSSESSINRVLTHNLNNNAQIHGVELPNDTLDAVGIAFSELIRKISEKHKKKVVVLIDEYDKPILDNITNQQKAAGARDILRNFYSIIKSHDTYLRLVFITGVSKFSKLNLFSGLNNMEDITIDKRFATITGYTHDDLLKYFSDYLIDVDMEEVRRWYNGYNYFGEPVYNPFDILLFCSKGNDFRNYWWQTGNPRFLIDILKQQPYFLPKLENSLVTEETLNTFDVEHIDLRALLWQTGYLTFNKRVGDTSDTFYLMKVPNLEVQKSLNHLFFVYLSKLDGRHPELAYAIKTNLTSGDFEGVREQIHSLFAAIPYQNYVNNEIGDFEGYYASVIFAFFSSLGFHVIAEDSTNHGRIDMTLVGRDQVFIIEFKVDASAEQALHQIKTKQYFEKYANQGKSIYLIGMHFDSQEKNIVGFEWELYE